MRKIISFLTIALFIISTIKVSAFNEDSVQYKNCTEYAEIITEIMTGDCNGDSDIFNMAYSYCKDNKFQGVEEVYPN